MCGIIAIAGVEPVNVRIYGALTVLQHRGQDAAGIATTDGERIYLRKNNGLAKDVFQAHDMRELIGHVGIGHVRYPTAGTPSSHEAQPLYVNSPFGIALAHNGNLTNPHALKRELSAKNRRHLNTNSDSEILLNVLAHELAQQDLGKLTPNHIFEAIKTLHERCEGAYAVVAVIPNFGIVAFRDPHGIRPLVMGVRHTAAGAEYVFASESVAFDALGVERLGDLDPGEAVVVETSNRKLSRQQCAAKTQLSPCLFEFVYFARPDSIIEGISVYKTRLRMGDFLAKKILKLRPEHNIDAVIPVPDTSRTAAIQVAFHLGVKYREGFIKNRYIGRTFIMPGQENRKKSVRQKLNPIPLEFRDKNVLLVDDSIVRGTTSSEIIRMAREAGAKQVYYASAAPPVRYPNMYGIDMPAATELIAHGREVDEISAEIGADWLVYQDLKDLVLCGIEGNNTIKQYEDSVFSGCYITGNPEENYLKELEEERGDRAQVERLQSQDETSV